MPTSPIPFVPRTPRNQNALIPDDRTFNDNYDPIIAQNDEATGASFVGTPGSNCYALRTEPFNECSNFLAILQQDNRVTSFYNLLYTNITGQNLSPEFIEGVSKSIFSEAYKIRAYAKSFINSLMANVSSNSYWVDPNGDQFGPSEPEYYDTTIDRNGWYLESTPSSTIDTLIRDKYLEAIELMANAIVPFNTFDITGESYTSDCVQENGRLTITTSGGTTAGVPWSTAVARYGPDAVRRGDFLGETFVYEGEVVYNPNEEATFFNMCVLARDCIKDYKANFPIEYELDVAALTDDQLAILSEPPDISEMDFTSNKQRLDLALKSIESAITYLLDPLYYEQPVRVIETDNNLVVGGLSSNTDLVSQYTVNDDGLLEEEVLYRLSISALAIKNTIRILIEVFAGIEIADLVSDYTEYVDDLKQQIQDEYDRRMEEEEAKREARAAAIAERFFVCRDQPPVILDVCADKPSPTKTFFLDWTKKDRNDVYYAPDLKKYYLVYDIVLTSFADIQAKIDSYKLEVFRLLDAKYVFNLFNNANVSEDTVREKANMIVKLEENGIYYEPRSFKPSKFLFSISEEDLSTEPKNLDIVPRFTNIPPNGKYVKSYSMTLRDFFNSLGAMEDVLKKYVFDYALWKITFGDLNPSINNLSISTNKIFKNLKTDILKQDSKNFQKLRPLFGRLLGKNGISLRDDIRLKRSGEFLLNDRIMLVFSFETPDNTPEPDAVEGTNVAFNGGSEVKPPANNTQTRPPTYNNSSGLATGFVAGTNVKLYRVQLTNGSRPPLDMIWKKEDGTGRYLEGLETISPFDKEPIMNYLMNMDMILPLVRPDKNDR